MNLTAFTDVDECSNNPCPEGAKCINTDGGFTCECPTGYTNAGSANGECLDINECGRGNACGINAKCINLPGSHKCLCPPGFSGKGDVFCESMSINIINSIILYLIELNCE